MTDKVRKTRKKKIRYSYALTKKILKLVESKMTISKICEIEGMPDRRSVHRWRHEHPDFDRQMMLSEKIRLSFLVDEMIDITNEDVILRLTKQYHREPTKCELYAVTQQLRLRVDTIKFLSAKLYGTRQSDVELTKIDNQINVISYESIKTSKQIQNNYVPDLQPAHLKDTAALTVAQKAQISQLTHR